jgi:outer membrane receptor protein involved in Fe transport
MKKRFELRRAPLVGAFLLPLALLHGQQAAPPATGDDDNIVVLTPFEVSGTRDRGYQATETLAGTRIRTNLRDVSSAISVITPEFLQDIGATDSATLLQYTPNAEVAGTRGTYAGLGNATTVDETGNLRAPQNASRVRGLAAPDNTRDFFGTDIPWDTFNISRIDINRGANSFLFGLGSPAGIVNAGTRNPEFRNQGSAEFRVGSYNSLRGSLDVNQVLVHNVLAFRVGALWDHEKFRQSFTHEDDERIYATVRFDPQLFRDRTWRTSLRVKYEHGDIDANRPRILPPQDSFTPWFRPVDTTSMFGGMGKSTAVNGYAVGSNAAAFNPWMSGFANQQQPVWFVDGSSNQLYRIYGGYVNTGSLNPNGTVRGAADAIIGQRYSDVFSQVGTFAAYANNVRLPNYQYGQYRNFTLSDRTVFDFYNTLIDGPTKKEWEGWDAYNIELSQTAWDDRFAAQFSYDRQKYDRGGQALLGNPTLNIDLLQNFQDYVVGPNNAANPSVANPNFGRPFVAGGPGRGSSYQSDREVYRATLFGELRTSDFLDNDFLVRLLGKHRFNGVYGDERYATENRGWQMHANSQAYAAYKTRGSPDGFQNLPPVAVIYLGPSVTNAPSASGLNIPGIGAPVTLQDGNIYQFDSTWRGLPGVNLTDPWLVPAGPLQTVPIFNGAPVINTTTGQPFAELTQASNPGNYVGWNSTFHNELLRYNDGEDLSLLTSAGKSLRQTKSLAASWQGYLWNESIVATFGWRRDEVRSKSVTALPQGAAARGALNINPSVFRLPDEFPRAQIFKDDSTAGGVVVHLNRLLGDRDPLPINVSLSYNKSSNFQVTDLRRGIYGNPIPNPTGETEDYGILLSTKDEKYSFRAIKYETNQTSTNTQLDNSGIRNTIVDAMNWRNIKVYYMALYDLNSANQTDVTPYTGRRYLWDPAYISTTTGRPVASGQATNPPAGSRLETPQEAAARRDAGIAAINNFQLWLTEKGYFQAWNFGAGPTTPSALQTRGQYETNPVIPAAASVYDYRSAPAMQGFAVTNDTRSEGYEFELTANPTRNWRLAFNASKTEAVRSNVGGPVLDELVATIDELMAGPGGDLVRFNSDYSAGNELRNVWNPWRGQYTLMKLQENTATSELRKWRYNVITNYSFTEGRLRGVGIGGSYRWQDKVVIGYPVIPDPVNPALASFDLSQPFHGPSEDAFDAWISYERRLTNRINWRIQLNGRNLLGKDELIPISVQPDGRTWAAARIAPNREWFITNTFSF